MPRLKEERVNIRIILAGMWTSVMFCYIYGDYFELYVPGKVDGLISGKNLLDTPMSLFLATILLTVPALLIFLTLILPARWTRTLNIIFGIFFTLLMLMIAATSYSEWRIFYVFLAVVESVITSLIVWYAWRKWKLEV